MMSSDAAAFAFNAWVWVKQPDYPWWPAMVLDPAQAGQELPEGNDLVLLCGPTAAATLAFANSADAAQVRRFRGASEDAELIQEGRQDESCAAAIDEMIAATAATSGTDAATAAERKDKTGNAPAAADADADDWVALMDKAEADMQAEQAQGETKHRKDKKDKKKEKKSKKEKSSAKTSSKEKKSRRRHRAEEASEGEASSDPESEPDYDDSDDGDLFRRRHGATSSRTAVKKARHDLTQTQLDRYVPHNDPNYLYRKARNARRSATTAELVSCANALRAVAGRCLSGAASPAEVEEELMSVLRQLTSLDVTVAQLQESGIGVAVGGLLRNFTTAVTQLADAILNYWFHSLPQTTKQQLAATTEVDEASVDTVASGSVEREGELGRLGVTLYGFFTNEEINDAPASADVVDICVQLEEALEKHCDADAQMLVLSAFGEDGSTGKHLRRLILEGRITADDVVKHADELPSLVRSNQRRPPNILTHTSTFSMNVGLGGGSPTSPNEVFSPNADGATGSPTFGSPTGRTTTSLYTCPQCGANEAYHSSYTVQAHDNMPDILLCKKCGTSWNVADQ